MKTIGEKKMHRNWYVSLFVLLAAVLVLSACGSASTPAPAAVEPTAIPPTAEPTTVPPAAEPTEASIVDPLSLYTPDAVSGDVITAGSSTVFPLSERMKQRFEEEGFTGNLTIDSIGSGAGFTRFCVDGDIDVANASRKIKDSEVESC
jgi:phosphate transport system substrate-binding protein